MGAGYSRCEICKQVTEQIKEIYVDEYDWCQDVCRTCQKKYFYVKFMDKMEGMKMLSTSGWNFHLVSNNGSAAFLNLFALETADDAIEETCQYYWTENSSEKLIHGYGDFTLFIYAASCAYIEKQSNFPENNYDVEYGATEEWVDMQRKRLDDEIKILKNKKRKLKC